MTIDYRKKAEKIIRWSDILFSLGLYGNEQRIPLNYRIFKQYFNPNKINAGHILSPYHVELLLKIQNSNSSISTFTNMKLSVFKYLGNEGIDGGGGVLALVTGYPLLIFPMDAYTEIDPIGKRWISLTQIYNLLFHNKVSIKTPSGTKVAFEKIMNFYNNVTDNWIKKRLPEIIDHKFTYQYRFEISQSIRSLLIEFIDTNTNPDDFTELSIMLINKLDKFIASYISFLYKVMETLFKKFHKEFKVIFYNLSAIQSNYVPGKWSENYFNEVVMTKFKIEEFLVLNPDYFDKVKKMTNIKVTINDPEQQYRTLKNFIKKKPYV